MFKFNKKIVACFFSISCFSFAQERSLETSVIPNPQVFHYEDIEALKNVSIQLQGESKQGVKWTTRNITPDDLSFLRKLYGDQDIMKYMCDGSTRNDDFISARIKVWSERAQNGIPMGTWILQTNEGQPFGILAAAWSGMPGICEVSYMILKEYQNQGFGQSALKQLVDEWAPETRRIGLLSEENMTTSKYRCFGENQVLKALYATASPANIPSWKIQLNTGFVPQEPDEGTALIDFSNKKHIKDEVEMEKELKALFNTNAELEPGKRYPFIDHKGEKKTVSLHKTYNKITYHFIYNLEGNN